MMIASYSMNLKTTCLFLCAQLRPMRMVACMAMVFLSIFASGIGLSQNPPRLELSGRVMVFAHRGASMERPEHTLGGYRLAIEQGADFIEPDLRMTKDKVFIALHDDSLNRTTDVATKPEFANRAHLDAKGRLLWFPADFTLAEIKTLRTKQGTARRATDFDGKETIPSLQEVVELIRTCRKETGRVVGLVPELRGNAEEFVRFMDDQKLLGKSSGVPLCVQSFSLTDLQQVRAHAPVQTAWLLTKWPETKDWRDLKQVVDALAISKNLVVANDGKERIAAAKAARLMVIAWTFGDDSRDHAGFATPQDELRRALENGIDAFFTDSPASGIRLRDAAAHASLDPSLKSNK